MADDFNFIEETKYHNYMYDDFIKIYAPYTSDPLQVGAIWEFDRSLSLLFLDYILLGEQLIKASLVRAVAKAYPKFNEDFASLGIAATLRKYNGMNQIDTAIFMKARIIAEEKTVKRISFGLLVNYLSLNAFKNMLKQMPENLFLAFLYELNEGQPDRLTPQDVFKSVELMHHLRNIAAHNGQLFEANTLELIKSYTQTTPRGVVDVIAKMLAKTNSHENLCSSYEKIMLRHRAINDKFKIWY